MDNPTGSAGEMFPASELQVQAKKRLHEFFQQNYGTNQVNALVPGTIAAVIFPVLSPAMTQEATVGAIQNGLESLDISFSADSVEKLLEAFESKQIDESDVQKVLEDLLPKDEQVNEEAAKALIKVVPEIKEAAMANPGLDPESLGQSLQLSLTDQGGVMMQLAPQLSGLIQLEGVELQRARDRLLDNWPQVINEATVSEYGSVTGSEQIIGDTGDAQFQRTDDPDHGKIS